jgi:hypothetical protein
MQVLRVCSFSTFALPPAFPPCCCPLAFRRQVRRLTSRMSSESYPGSPECVVSCHGAGRLANSIRPYTFHIVTASALRRARLGTLGRGRGGACGQMVQRGPQTQERLGMELRNP